MAAVVLAFVASLGWGSSSFIAGLQARRLHVLVVLAVAQIGALLLLATVLAIRGTGVEVGDFLIWAAVAGAAEALGVGALYRGLAVGSMGIVAPISATAVVIPVAVGVASGERLSGLQAAGIALAVVGLVIAARDVSAPASTTRVAAGVSAGLLAALGFGVFYVAIAEASAQADPLWVVFISRWMLAIIVFAGIVLVRPRGRPAPRQTTALVSAGVLESGGTTAYSVATRHGLLSEVAVIGSLYPLVTMILARAVLAERVPLVQRGGALLALGGVALLAAG